MAYNQNIPKPGDLISVSQGQILANFQAIQTLIDVNHVDFADAGNMGKHKFVTFTDQTALPPVAAGTDLNMYNAVDGNTGLQELWIGNSAGSTIPFTSGIFATPGWTFIPSGIMIQWGNGGNINDNQNPLITVTFSRSFPNACFQVIVCPLLSNAGLTPPLVYTGGVTAMNFLLGAKNGNSGNTSSYRYIAIGY